MRAFGPATYEADDLQALAALYEQHRRPLYAFCLARTHDPALAEDIVQDVFETAVSLRSRYDPTRPFWSWIASIAARDCMDAQRRRAYALSRGPELARMAAVGAEPADTTSSAALRRLERTRLEREMDRLPIRQRVALQLFAMDGWSYAEIAEQFGDSVAGVKALIVRARRRLREACAGGFAVVARVGRGLRSRSHEGVVRAQAALSVCGETLGHWLCSPAAAASGIASMTAVAGLAVSSVVPIVPAGEPGARPPGTVSRPADPSPGPALAPPEAAAPPAPLPPEPVAYAEPVSRQYTGTAERTANDAVNPVLFRQRLPVSADGKWFTSVAVSPGYRQDRTVFALGAPSSWDRPQLLLVTRDGGASWTELMPSGLRGGFRLFLPPAFPHDYRMFAYSGYGLHLSRDGGAHFETVVSGPVEAVALSPLLNAGDPRILLVMGGRLFEYRDDTGLLRPLSVGGALDAIVQTVEHSPDYASDGTVLLGLLVRSRGETSLSRCTQTAPGSAGSTPSPLLGEELACDHRPVPAATMGLRRIWASSRSRPGLLYARGANDLFVSADGGATPQPVRPSWGSFWVNDVAPLPSPTGESAVAAGLHGTFGEWSTPLSWAPLMRTDDGGRTWRKLAVDLPGYAAGAYAVGVTPTGRIIATGYLNGGIICSADGGATWAATCPGPDTG